MAGKLRLRQERCSARRRAVR